MSTRNQLEDVYGTDEETLTEAEIRDHLEKHSDKFRSFTVKDGGDTVYIHSEYDDRHISSVVFKKLQDHGFRTLWVSSGADTSMRLVRW